MTDAAWAGISAPMASAAPTTLTVITHRVTGDHIAAPYRVMAGASILFAASLERAGWPAIVRQPARVTQEEENFCFKCLVVFGQIRTKPRAPCSCSACGGRLV